MNRTSASLRRHGRRACSLAIFVLTASLAAACASPGSPPDVVDVRPRPSAAPATGPAQCVPEGEPCDAPGAVCCPNTTCAGIGKPVCIHAY